MLTRKVRFDFLMIFTQAISHLEYYVRCISSKTMVVKNSVIFLKLFNMIHMSGSANNLVVQVIVNNVNHSLNSTINFVPLIRNI